MTSRRLVGYTLAGAAITLLAGRMIAALYVDYLWFAAMGAAALWREQMTNLLMLRGLAGLVGSTFVFLNLLAVRHSVVSLVLPRRVANIEIGEEVPGRYLTTGVVALSLLIGGLLTIPLGQWTLLALVRYGVPFRETDPYFQLGLGEFVYWLPFERALYVWSLIVLFCAAAATIVLYALTPSLRWERGALRVTAYVRRHLTVFGVLLLLLLAWSYRLDAYGVLVDGSGPEGAFTYADHRVALPLQLALQLVTTGAAILVLWAGWTGQLRLAFGAVTMVLLLSLVLRQALPTVVRRFAPQSDPAVRERPYVAVRNGFTQSAYDVRQIAIHSGAARFATAGDAALGTSVWDARALLRALGRGQRSPNGMAEVGWRATPVGIVAQAVDRAPSERLAAAAPWSVARVQAARVDARGAPVRVDARGLPTDEDTPLPPALVEPAAAGYLLISDSLGRVPAAPLSDGWSRLAHAWSLQNVRLLVADLPHPDPRILLRRDVRERVRALTPFFAQGTSVSPVVAADSLFWVLHLYTASAAYPLSRHIDLGSERVSYLHHAAVAVVQASTGEVTIVADSLQDPIARTWTRRFPSLFGEWSALPADLPRAVPPAIDAAMAQGSAFASAGTRAESAARFRLPSVSGADSTLAAGGGPFIALGTDSGLVAWTVPLLGDDDRVRGLIVATGGLHPTTWWHELAAPGPRWNSIVERLRRSPDSVQSGDRLGRVARGPIRAVPVGDDALYLQSHYRWQLDAAPAVERVHVLVGDSVISARSFVAAVGAEVPPDSVAAPVAGPVLEQTAFRARVAAAYDSMRAALRRGDWSAFGAAYNALGRLLGRPPR